MLQPRPKLPLVRKATGRTDRRRVGQPTSKNGVVNPWNIPDQEHHDETGQNATAHSFLVLSPHKANRSHHYEIECSERHNVVQHVRQRKYSRQTQSQQVQAPQNIHYPRWRKVSRPNKEQSVPKSCHPKIRRHKNPHHIVDLLAMKVVIQQKKQLHPPLPLLRLISGKNAWLASGQVSGGPHEGNQSQEHDCVKRLRLCF
mmetsp:Transcript_109187/g.250517  ORF Transcript_109187/g.250517 Transcript_109187/m.250517 type:complete len:200 (-) Transcript_109187:246-845(-)